MCACEQVPVEARRGLLEPLELGLNVLVNLLR